MRVIGYGAAAVLLLMSAYACQPPVTPADELDKSLRAYHGHLRWKRFSKAAAFVSKDQQEKFIEVFEPNEDQLNIDDLEVKNVDIEKDKAKVTVEARFYKLPSITMAKARVVERWERIGGNWWLASDAQVPFFEVKPDSAEKTKDLVDRALPAN